jgi:SAM-dependent methyltransferase
VSTTHEPGTGGPGTLIGPAFTDLAGDPASMPQLARLHARYRWLRSHCVNRDVLEVACGSGQGLGVVARDARRVFGGDYSVENLVIARHTYEERMPLLRLDAQRLPIKEASLDVIALLEALYFLPDPDAFVSEAARALRPGGQLLISVINKDCWDFNPNPLYPHLFGAPELAALLRHHGFSVECFGDIPLDRPSLRHRLFHPLKRIAIFLHLIPRTLQARLWLKRIVFGKLVAIPFEIAPDVMPGPPPIPIATDRPDSVHQVVLATGRRPV